MEEHEAYCRLNAEGDVEPIISLHDLSSEAGQGSAMLVTMDAEQLHRYMAVTETAIVLKFDFTRYRPSGGFGGWHEPQRSAHTGHDLLYYNGILERARLGNGAVGKDRAKV